MNLSLYSKNFEIQMTNFLFFVADISSFQAFFNYIDMRVLLENFCVYHVNAPGQEEGALTLPEEWVYVILSY